MVFQQNLLEKAYFIAKMSGLTMVRPASSDFWKAPYVYYMASSCLGDRKQVQDARFDSHLTGVEKESFYWRTKTIAHDKGFPRK